MGGQQAAEAAECADEQGAFWEYHNGLFENPGAYSSIDDFVGLADDLGLKTSQFRQCLESGKYKDEVLADQTEARSYGVTGTPTFFINGVRIVGARPLDTFTSIIDDELGN